MTNATVTKAQAANLNPIAMGLAQLVQANIALSQTKPTELFVATGNHASGKIVTDMAMKDVSQRYPDAEAMKTAGQDAVFAEAHQVKAKRIVAVTESETRRQEFIIEFWQANDKKEVELVQRFTQVASLAAWAWVQSITDYLLGADTASIAFPDVISQYLQANDRSYKDARGLVITVAAAESKKVVPALVELFDPAIRPETSNPFAQFFHHLLDRQFINAKKWNMLMTNYLADFPEDQRESARANLQDEFLSADMSWETLQKGFRFLKVEEGEIAVDRDAIVEGRVAYVDNVLLVMACAE